MKPMVRLGAHGVIAPLQMLPLFGLIGTFAYRFDRDGLFLVRRSWNERALTDGRRSLRVAA